MSESDAELVRKVSDRLAHADELRRQLDKSIAECVALTARAEAAEARARDLAIEAHSYLSQLMDDDSASRARREALEEAAKVADTFRCGSCGMDGQAAAAIRALIDSEKAPAP